MLAHTCRCAGGNDVARLDCEHARADRDRLRDEGHHLCGVRTLHHLAASSVVSASTQRSSSSPDVTMAARTGECVKSLPLGPLPCLTLEIAALTLLSGM